MKVGDTVTAELDTNDGNKLILTAKIFKIDGWSYYIIANNGLTYSCLENELTLLEERLDPKELLDLIETKLSEEPWFVVGKLTEIVDAQEKRIAELEHVEDVLQRFQQLLIRENAALYQKIVNELRETPNEEPAE
jgi:hypothetical protein